MTDSDDGGTFLLAFLTIYVLFVLLPVFPFVARAFAGSVSRLLERRGVDEEPIVRGNPGVIVTLVHGTWGRNSLWTKEGSELRRRLSDSFKDEGIEFVRHPWSGSNSFNRRQDAASALRQRLAKAIERHPKARHLIVGHSHGGSVALMAMGKEPPEQVAGIACLATPVLTVRRPTYNPLTLLALRWSPIGLLIAPLVLLEGITPNGWLVFGPLLAAAFIVVVLGFFLSPDLRGLAPDPCLRDQVVFFRSPGDEASLVIGATTLLRRTLDALVIAPLAGAEKMIQGSENRRKSLANSRWWLGWAVLGLVSGIALFVGGLSLLDYSPFETSQHLIVPGTLLGVIMLAIPAALHLRFHYLLYLYAFALTPILLPALILGAGLLGLAAGREAILAAISWHISAETTPPGQWTVVNITDESGGFIHSAIYQNEAALSELAHWAKARVASKVADPISI